MILLTLYLRPRLFLLSPETFLNIQLRYRLFARPRTLIDYRIFNALVPLPRQ